MSVTKSRSGDPCLRCRVHAKEILWSLVRGVAFAWKESRGKRHERVAMVLPSRSTNVTERENTAKDDRGNDEV